LACGAHFLGIRGGEHFAAHVDVRVQSFIVCVAVCACDPSEETVSCPEALATYCASAPCVLHVDRNDIVESFCDSLTTNVQLGIFACDDGGANLVQSSIGTFQYDKDGNLVAVTQMTIGGDPFYRCFAGPTRLAAPSRCLSDLVGFECVVVDAGAD
jgi:hypothetical protein